MRLLYDDVLRNIFSLLDEENWNFVLRVCKLWRKIGLEVFDPEELFIKFAFQSTVYQIRAQFRSLPSKLHPSWLPLLNAKRKHLDVCLNSPTSACDRTIHVYLSSFQSKRASCIHEAKFIMAISGATT